jgi:dGTP triphosphohydrolase
LLPEEYLRVDSKKHASIKDLDDNLQIEQIQLINDYLTGMSDNYACNLYKKLRGVEQVTF